MRKNVLLGFSGGIDSTAAARYLAEQGHAVTLLTLDTVGEEGLETRIRQAAGRLNLPFRIEKCPRSFPRRDRPLFYPAATCAAKRPRPALAAIPGSNGKRCTTSPGANITTISPPDTTSVFAAKTENTSVRTAADPAKDQSLLPVGLVAGIPADSPDADGRTNQKSGDRIAPVRPPVAGEQWASVSCKDSPTPSS